MHAVLFCALVLGQGEAKPLSPADAMSHAHADLAALPIGDRTQFRYLSLYNVDPLSRPNAIQVLNGHVNGLSRESDLTPVKIVPNTQGALVRINLLDYRWDVKTWEKLIDPYFTTTLEIESAVAVPWEGGVWPADGKSYPAGSFTVTKKKKVTALAPWIGETEEQRQKLADVVKWTQSKVPIVRADWFFNQTAAAVDRSPNYYDFLGIKDEKTYQEAIGADLKAAEKFGSELRESVAISGVTLLPRAISRHPTLGGGYWRTFDFKSVNDKKNPLRVLGKDIEKDFDATEQFGHLPNGLWATGLFDRQGKIQATAPDNIASDSASKSNDRRVHVNVSCLRCHANGGLQDIDGWVRNLLTPPLELRSTDYDRARELRRQYVRKLDPAITKDRQIFDDAIFDITRMTSKQYAKEYGDFWERYEDAKIGIKESAIDLGVSEKYWRAALEAKVKTGQGDTALSAMLLDNPRLNRIPIRVWEESVSLAHTVLRYYRP